jgi:ABC-type Zn uptake system ZnuABC Zn-binding protein ZnuA
MKIIRNLFLVLLLAFSFSYAKKTPKKAKIAESAKIDTMFVATSIPALKSLAQEILKGTPVSVVNPFGNGISLDELEGISKQFEEELTELSPKVSAVINIRSIIPADQLFIHIRHKNIRVVEIDCATPLSPVLTAVGKVKKENGETSPFVWLSLSNSIRMAEVLQSDLSALFPKYAEKISANLTDFKLRANAMRNEFAANFLEIENFNAITLSGDFDYLLKDIDLFIIERFSPEYDWSAEQTEKFAKLLETQSVGVIINRWETGSPADKIMQKFGVKTAILQTGIPADDAFENGFLEFWKENISAILSAMMK